MSDLPRTRRFALVLASLCGALVVASGLAPGLFEMGWIWAGATPVALVLSASAGGAASLLGAFVVPLPRVPRLQA